MAEKQYTYAVARIRTKELSLLKSAFLEQLLAAKSYAECIQLLSEKGWGDGTATDAEQILKGEQEKTWALMEELVDDVSVFDVFLYANDYHNLKAAIKMVYLDTERREAFFSHGTVQPETMLKALREQDYSLLPEAMRAPAKEAFDLLLHTRDGQLCDVVVDRAALDAIYAAGKAADHPIIREYAELTVAAADIKIAVRAQKTGKSLDFLKRALAPCDSLDVEQLAKASLEGQDAVYSYLQRTAYADAVPVLQESPSAFERWCDNLIIRDIRPQQYNPFTIGPLAAYILARENEVKTVRIILSGKWNHLREEAVRDRMREMYRNV